MIKNDARRSITHLFKEISLCDLFERDPERHFETQHVARHGHKQVIPKPTEEDDERKSVLEILPHVPLQTQAVSVKRMSNVYTDLHVINVDMMKKISHKGPGVVIYSLQVYYRMQ